MILENPLSSFSSPQVIWDYWDLRVPVGFDPFSVIFDNFYHHQVFYQPHQPRPVISSSAAAIVSPALLVNSLAAAAVDTALFLASESLATSGSGVPSVDGSCPHRRNPLVFPAGAVAANVCYQHVSYWGRTRQRSLGAGRFPRRRADTHEPRPDPWPSAASLIGWNYRTPRRHESL